YSDGWAWARLRSTFYRFAACVVVQTETVLDHLTSPVRRRAAIIPNPVAPPPTAEEPKRPRTGKTLLAMGRFTEEKGFASLIRAFGAVASNHPDWTLEIWGDGPLREELIRVASEIGLRDRVMLPGYTSRPHEPMRRAD